MKCFVAYQLMQSVNFTLIAISLFGFLFQIAAFNLGGTTISFFVLISSNIMLTPHFQCRLGT
jgi:hypothetical protein